MFTSRTCAFTFTLDCVRLLAAETFGGSVRWEIRKYMHATAASRRMPVILLQLTHSHTQVAVTQSNNPIEADCTCGQQ